MRQLIALVILAGIAVGGWMYWPQIKAMIVSHAEGDAKTEAEPDPKGTPATTPGTSTPGTSTPSTPTPGSTIPTTTPGLPTPGTVTPGSTLAGDFGKVEGPVTLDLRAVPDENGQMFDLEGTTNLLPGTQLELAITARTGAVTTQKPRVEAGSPKNTFKTVNHQLPDGQYQIDVIMYVNRQTELGLTSLYSQPQMLKGPLVFNTTEGPIVRATGVFQKTKRKTPVEIGLKAGKAR